jgi:hypothetical protein
MIDGVYEIRPTGAVVFHPAPAPTDEDVAAVAEQIYWKVTRALDARGDHDGTALASAEPVLATLAGASVAGVAAIGPRRGRGRCASGREPPQRRPSPAVVAPLSRGLACTPTFVSPRMTATASSFSRATSRDRRSRPTG